MKKRWIVILGSLIGIVSIMGTSARTNRLVVATPVVRQAFSDTVPNKNKKKKDTSSYPKKDTMRLDLEPVSNQ